jgi:hypothetical protein
MVSQTKYLYAYVDPQISFRIALEPLTMVDYEADYGLLKFSTGKRAQSGGRIVP